HDARACGMEEKRHLPRLHPLPERKGGFAVDELTVPAGRDQQPLEAEGTEACPSAPSFDADSGRASISLICASTPWGSGHRMCARRWRYSGSTMALAAESP